MDDSGVGIKMTDSLKFPGSNYFEAYLIFSSKLSNDTLNFFKEQCLKYPKNPINKSSEVLEKKIS